MATSSSSPLTVFSVLSESRRIINAHSRHFLALSVIFILPLSFLFTLLPTLIVLFLPTISRISGDSMIFFFALFLSVLALIAAASISSSVLRGFYGRPVRLLSAVRSAVVVFFPLLATSLIVALIASAFAASAALALFLALLSANLLGYKVDYSSPYFLGLLTFLSATLLAGLIFLDLNWTLAPAIVVAESDWGFSALRRSSGLIRGSRRVAASLLAFLGLSAVAISWVAASLAVTLGGTVFFGSWWESLEAVVLIAVASAFMTVVILYSVAANTVLYMHCKAVHGELATEIAAEFAAEYVSLPFDDQKVPHLVSVTYT